MSGELVCPTEVYNEHEGKCNNSYFKIVIMASLDTVLQCSRCGVQFSLPFLVSTARRT